ncbi:phage antirepressor [Levilactobacillus zymae]|uniref:phage antirepressor n=2 Tax=Levilactobacillus zymae TaxID=267363 RepID=UPI00070956F6|nr:phage antirepressor KilAC domain-containing protein [Levilactobacillus zymae]QFR61046.1 phage antirepressor protein [Levilactobacillus zymae]
MVQVKKIIPFNFEGNQVRTISGEENPCFVGRDVAMVLGYSRPADAVRKHVDEEDKGVSILATPGGNQRLVTITESGVYSLILTSKLPSAKRFKHWVTSEVLPAIRKDGAYVTPKTAEEWLNNPDMMIQVLQRYKDDQARIKQLHDENRKLQPKADYTDRMLSNPGLETTSMIAKNYGYSTIKFNRMLYALGVQYRQGGVWMLYAKYQGEGYTQIEPYEFINHVDKRQVANTMKWTQKGAKFLYDFLKAHGILPKVEQLELEGME